MNEPLFPAPAPTREGRRGKPFREGEAAIFRVNVHLTDGQMRSIRQAYPDRKPADVVLLALASFVPTFQTEVKP